MATEQDLEHGTLKEPEDIVTSCVPANTRSTEPSLSKGNFDISYWWEGKKTVTMVALKFSPSVFFFKKRQLFRVSSSSLTHCRLEWT